MRNNYYLRRMLAGCTAALSVCLLSACGEGTVTETAAGLSFAETSAEAAAVIAESLQAAAETADTETEKKPETAKPAAVRYGDETQPVYDHRELSDLLLEKGYLENAEGFAYGPYLEPGEDGTVQISSVPDGDGTVSVTRADCRSFSYPELGIRAISFPSYFHMDGEVLSYKEELLSWYRMPDDVFEETFGAPVQPDGNDYTVVQLVRQDVEEGTPYEGDREFTEECVLDTGGSYPGAFARSAKDGRYGVVISCRRTGLEISTATIKDLTTQESVRSLWAYPVPEPFTGDPMHVMQKDGYWYLYATTRVIRTPADGSPAFSEDIGYLFRVKDGISQGVRIALKDYDEELAQKLLDYILNYSLEFYDIGTIRYDAFGENGERWYELCESFYCQ